MTSEIKKTETTKGKKEMKTREERIAAYTTWDLIREDKIEELEKRITDGKHVDGSVIKKLLFINHSRAMQIYKEAIR